MPALLNLSELTQLPRPLGPRTLGAPAQPPFSSFKVRENEKKGNEKKENEEKGKEKKREKARAREVAERKEKAEEGERKRNRG